MCHRAAELHMEPVMAEAGNKNGGRLQKQFGDMTTHEVNTRGTVKTYVLNNGETNLTTRF